MSPDPLRDASLLELFAMEAEAQAAVLAAGLIALEREPDAVVELEACMRAAHSLKGAARIVGLDAGVQLAHRMEDCLVAAQQGALRLGAAHIDALLAGTDLLQKMGTPPDGDPAWTLHGGKPDIDAAIARLDQLLQPPSSTGEDAAPDTEPEPPHGAAAEPAAASPDDSAAPRDRDVAAADAEPQHRMLRVSADHLDQLLALSSETLVQSGWVRQFGEQLAQTRRQQQLALKALERLPAALAAPAGHAVGAAWQEALSQARRAMAAAHRQLTEQLIALDQFERCSTQLSSRLYDAALASRMRPFADRAGGYVRLVRDLARELGKRARLEVIGGSTLADRDILDQLDAPLTHLLGNAMDHGIEPPEHRLRAGKPAEGRIVLHVRHRAGRLLLDIEDDGGGVDLDMLREAIVQRGMAGVDTARRMSTAELLEFLLLPGFSLRDTVSEVSGRGVGLDAVRDMVRRVQGSLRIAQQPGKGMRICLELPLTLSVVRAMLVEVDGEPYAFPLGRVERALRLQPEQIELVERHEHFRLPPEGPHLGLVSAAQLLGKPVRTRPAEAVPVVVVGEPEHRYGIAVDRLLGERMLVIQPLPARLGKVRDIAAAARTEDGAPVLVFDVDDLLRSAETLLSEGRLRNVRQSGATPAAQRRKRVLIVEDSLTVRELERKLLANRGYEVVVAVDGMDGWNAVRAESFDLVITDIDMPRMDGIQLVTLIKGDARLQRLPVMVVSYKDREQDRRRGLDAGADYYLAKGSFHDAALLDAVHDLIGDAAE